MKKRTSAITLMLAVLLLVSTPLWAAERHTIRIPDILGYKTLKCDFHMHTVFSDGSVWPTVRVDEAWRDGLDAIAITDHIEYQPKKDDVNPDANRPYAVASKRAKDKDILLVKGTEITRDTPPGHFNAIYIKDAEALRTPEFHDVLEEAHHQDAFVFWNHPGWKAKNGESYWFDIHTRIFDEKLVQGIEVINGKGYYADAHKWCLEKNLTMFGNSDVHAPMLPNIESSRDHRPVTLVFAKERSLKSIREALDKHRTALWSQEKLIGKEDFLDAIFKASIKVTKTKSKGKAIWLEIANGSDVPYRLIRTGDLGPETLDLSPNDILTVKLKLPKDAQDAALSYTAKNLLIEPDKGLPVKIAIP